MRQPGGDLDLPQEPLGTQGGHELGLQYLDGNPAAVFEILGQINDRHAATSQFPLDAIAAGKGVLQATQQVRRVRGG